ncbi:Anaphase-promoting complex subunit, partial [Perkinsus olseni]
MYVDMLATLTTTDAADEIFLYAEKLLERSAGLSQLADRPEPWYAAGIYHQCAADMADGNFAHVHRESSRRYLARALEVCPHFGPAWIALGRSFAVNDETERAIQAYRSATKHCPEWHMPWLLIGMEHLRVGHSESYSGQGVHLEHATALTYLERAKDLTPIDSEVRNQIGIYHSKSGDHEQAIKSFIEAIESENSRKHGRVAVAQTKNFARYQNNLAFSLCQNGQLEEAAEACQKALKAAPNGNCAEAMESHQMLAFVLSKQGRPSQAIDHYHQAIGIGEKARGNVSTRAAHSLVNRLMRNISRDGIPGCLSMENLVRHVESQMAVD